MALFVCALAAGAQTMAGGHSDKPVTATQCHWLTSGTAANVLGGDVTATISGSDMNEGSCRFVRRDASMGSLEIHVSAQPLRGCPAGSAPLHGIGNEAQRCVISREHGMAEDMASGSVRNLHFSVTLSLPGNRRSGKNADPADDPVARIADEVAGNLY